MKKVFFIISLCCFTSLTALSQDALVEDGAFPEAEFDVAINPLDSNNIVLAVQSGFTNPNSGDIRIYYTTDFGLSWQVSNYNGAASATGDAGDAVLSFDASGNVYLTNLRVVGGDIATVLAKSSDGGATWGPSTTIVSSNSDKPWLAIDRYSSSPYEGNIYIPLVKNGVVLYTINGTQISGPATLPDGNHLPSIAVKKDGTVFISTVKMTDPNRVFVQEYSNGGTTMVHSTQVVSFPSYLFNAPQVSTRFQPTVYLAVDNSGGPYDGRLYMSYTASEENFQDYFDVFLTYSDDNGVTWSNPKRVHSNQEDKKHQFYSSLYVNDNGVLILDWYDRKNYSTSSKMTDFLMGVSYNGGSTFAEVQLNSVSSDFNDVIPSSGGFGIGEYHQLVATKSTAVSFWSDGRTNDGDLNIYMSKVDLNSLLDAGVVEHGVVSDKISVTLYPQPVEGVVNASIELAEKTTLKYEIYDNAGKRMNVPKWEDYSLGEHEIAIDLDAPAGMYFVKFSTDKGYFKSMKLIKK